MAYSFAWSRFLSLHGQLSSLRQQYGPCPSLQVVTPDLKLGDGGVLIHVDLAEGRRRLGGSALAQVRVLH